ncbi:hypothetical protein ACA910_004419 [Epithemia clementina (nom. ined.)]
MSIVGAGEAFNIPQIDATLKGLDYLARINREAGCMGDYVDPFQDYVKQVNATDEESSICWIPVIKFSEAKDKFEALLQAVLAHEYPPGFILDVTENGHVLNQPQKV